MGKSDACDGYGRRLTDLDAAQRRQQRRSVAQKAAAALVGSLCPRPVRHYRSCGEGACAPVGCSKAGKGPAKHVAQRSRLPSGKNNFVDKNVTHNLVSLLVGSAKSMCLILPLGFPVFTLSRLFFALLLYERNGEHRRAYVQGVEC